MTDIAIQCTTHDNTSGNVHVITVQSIITFLYATCYIYIYIKALYQIHTHVYCIL